MKKSIGKAGSRAPGAARSSKIVDFGKQFKPKEIWQKYSSYNVAGCAIDSGHFIPEEKPLDTIKELTNFFLSI